MSSTLHSDSLGVISTMKYKPVILHFKFDDFLTLLSQGAVIYEDQKLDCNGHGWGVSVNFNFNSRRRGDSIEVGFRNLPARKNNNGEDEFEDHVEDRDVCFELSVKDAKGETVKKVKGSDDRFHSIDYPAFMKRLDILDDSNSILKDGALCIDVRIQVRDELEELYDPKENRAHQNKGLELLKNKEKADLSIYIHGELFQVHSLILDNYAPLLADYCKQNDGSSNGDIRPDVFQKVLEYVYSGICPFGDIVGKFGKELIDAANRFELVELKLAIERLLVRERILDKTNVADYIVFADAQSCPLLKEYAISYFLLHAKEILNSDYSKALRESGELLSEIIKMLTSQDENGIGVNELRKELSKRKLDVDGSKEALTFRLEESKQQRTE